MGVPKVIFSLALGALWLSPCKQTKKKHTHTNTHIYNSLKNLSMKFTRVSSRGFVCLSRWDLPNHNVSIVPDNGGEVIEYWNVMKPAYAPLHNNMATIIGNFGCTLAIVGMPLVSGFNEVVWKK